MEERRYDLIEQLMEELSQIMEPGEADLSERLGRPKPEVDVMSIEAEEDPMAEGPGFDDMMEDEEPGAGLKRRLMKIRGA